MNKRRIVIVNRGRGRLIIHCEKCGVPGSEELNVGKRKVLRLGTGKYKLKFFYRNRSVHLQSSMKDSIEPDDIVSSHDNHLMGKVISLDEDIQKLRIICREHYSIASIVEGVSD